MPRMYADDEIIPTSISFEAFLPYYLNASVVSTESLDRYFGKVKDLFKSTHGMFTSDQDRFVRESLNSKFEVAVLSREVRYVDFRHASVSRPEGFSGLYLDYLETLAEVAQGTLESVTKSIDHLKISVAAFINDYQDNQADSLYGHRYFVQEKKVIDGFKDRNQKFFKALQNKTKTTAQEVIRSMSDIERIYPLVDTVATTLNQLNADHIEKNVQDLTELIDALVEQNLTTGILVKSQGAKKELMEAIDQTARAVEFYTALHAEFFAFCSSFKTLTDALKTFK